LNQAVDIETKITQKESAATVIKRVLDIDDYANNTNELTKLIKRHDVKKMEKKRLGDTVNKLDRIVKRWDRRDDLLVPLQEFLSNTDQQQQDYVTATPTRQDQLLDELVKEVNQSSCHERDTTLNHPLDRVIPRSSDRLPQPLTELLLSRLPDMPCD
jgi:hypothetical protein